MIYLAIKHLYHLLGDRDFVVYTDHKTLTTLMNSNSDKYTSKEIRHFDYISQFTIDIRHVNGKNNSNTVANTNSRADIN